MTQYIISFLLGISASAIAAIPGMYLYFNWKRYNENRPLKSILNFSNDNDLIFVFSHRNDYESSRAIILPRTSTEDFMAINNLKSALININWIKLGKVRDTRTMEKREDDKRKNIISICSSKSNSFTREVEQKLLEKYTDFFRGVEDQSNGEWYITDGKFPYRTDTYQQHQDYIDEGVDRNNIPAKEFEDVGYITKVTNPFEGRTKILIVAGVRGIGTWGAAECIKKEWHQLYDKLPKGKKTVTFRPC